MLTGCHRKAWRSIAIAGMAVLVWTGTTTTTAKADSQAGLFTQFSEPPDDCRAWAFYFVGDGNHPLVTREGLTRDLASMKEQGLGGIVLFYGWAFRDQSGKMLWQNQEPWWELMRHAIREANRLGLRVLLFNSPVWNSGGPWIKPDQAMKEYTWSRLEVQGPQRFSGALPSLPAREGFVRDAALIAFPTPDDGRTGRMRSAQPTARTSANLIGRKFGEPEAHERQPSDLYAPGDALQSLSDGNLLTRVTLSASEKLRFVEYEFAQPFACDSLFLKLDDPHSPETVECELLVATDPAKTTFAKLDSWTQHSDPGVRHYSGTAVYRKQFDLRNGAGFRESGFLLNLGRVKNLARVTLNGQPLGDVWTAPWQVAIPAGLLRNQGNELQIEVANLWINRLQFDRTLPEAERLTWTNAGAAALGGKDLLPAGLLGPVAIAVTGKE